MEFTLVPELQVIVWNSPSNGSSSKRIMNVPYAPDLEVKSSYREFSDEEREFGDGDCPLQYKEYVFTKVELPNGRHVWMTPYDPTDETQQHLIKEKAQHLTTDFMVEVGRDDYISHEERAKQYLMRQLVYRLCGTPRLFLLYFTRRVDRCENEHMHRYTLTLHYNILEKEQ